MARVAHLYGKKLAAARSEKSMTQRELGEAIGGVSDETISRVERSEVAGILAKRLPRLAAVFNMSLDDFKSRFCVPHGKLPEGSATQKADWPMGINLRRIRDVNVLPEFSIGVAANRRVDKLSEYPQGNRPTAAGDRRAFTAPVDGDCQTPKWRDGEIVIFSYDAIEREGIVPGKSYYLAFTDGSSTFKRVFLDERDPDVYILRCWNRKKYPNDHRVHREEVVRIARAISKQVTVDEGDE
jgi:transcriptional regulator with XRE-family HTH domain